jgi:hypothetical protein
VARFDKAITQESLVSDHDGIAAGTDLLRQASARRKIHSGLEQPVDDRGTKRGLYLLPLVSDRPIQTNGEVQYPALSC